MMKKIIALFAFVSVMCSLSAQKVSETTTLYGKDQLTGFTTNIEKTPVEIVENTLVNKFEGKLNLKGSKKKGFHVYENQTCPTFGEARYDIYFTTLEVGKKKNKGTQVILVVSTGNMNCITFSTDPRTSRNIVSFLEELQYDVEVYKTDMRIEQLKDEIAALEKERQSIEKDQAKVKDKITATNDEMKKNADLVEKKTNEITRLQERYASSHDAALKEQISTIAKEKQTLLKTQAKLQKSLLGMNDELYKLTNKLDANAKAIEEKTAELKKLQR